MPIESPAGCAIFLILGRFSRTRVTGIRLAILARFGYRFLYGLVPVLSVSYFLLSSRVWQCLFIRSFIFYLQMFDFLKILLSECTTIHNDTRWMDKGTDTSTWRARVKVSTCSEWQKRPQWRLVSTAKHLCVLACDSAGGARQRGPSGTHRQVLSHLDWP